MNKGRYVVKWRHAQDPHWHNFVKPEYFDNLTKAQDFIDQCYRDDSGFTRFRVFERGGGKR